MGTGTGTGNAEATYDEESVDPVYGPVPVEVQGIIYIYNPPVVPKADEKGGEDVGQPTAAVPASGPAGTGVPVPAANKDAAPAAGTPVTGAAGTGAAAPPATNKDSDRSAAPSSPAKTGAPASPPTSTPATGGRP